MSWSDTDLQLAAQIGLCPAEVRTGGLAELAREALLLRTAARCAYAFLQMPGRRGELGRIDEVFARRTATLEALAALPAASFGDGLETIEFADVDPSLDSEANRRLTEAIRHV